MNKQEEIEKLKRCVVSLEQATNYDAFQVFLAEAQDILDNLEDISETWNDEEA